MAGRERYWLILYQCNDEYESAYDIHPGYCWYLTDIEYCRLNERFIGLPDIIPFGGRSYLCLELADTVHPCSLDSLYDASREYGCCAKLRDNLRRAVEVTDANLRLVRAELAKHPIE